jgi:ubiquinone/menaquinone biosynthesis C-methylase UbiE
VGLDVSRRMGRLARRRLGKAGLTVPLVQARAQALPFCDGCFDSAVATFPAEFIVDPATLREAARALRVGGRLVVVAGVCLGGRDLLSRFIAWLYRVTGQGKPPPVERATPVIEAGFVPRTVWEQVGRSSVMLFLADRR